MKEKFDRYVHEFTDSQGRSRFAVAEWDEASNQFRCPLSKKDQELTGCHTEFARRVSDLGGYLSRTKALRRARYIFGEKDN